MQTKQSRRNRFIAAFYLLFMTVALYWPATDYQFVRVDDDEYVYDNPHVTGGPTPENIQWAFTSTDASNWHPLTWLTHIFDQSVYHTFAGGHHLTSIILHGLSAVILFLWLCRVTKTFWPPLLTAALFAWHPLRVESVAWIAERKDVLSAFFFLTTLWAYTRYAEKMTPRRYAITLALFAAGLMSKPMLVTLPFVLLLLDYWPLRRSYLAAENSGAAKIPLDWLVLEKIPFFLFSIVACVVTVIAQSGGGAIKTTVDIPLTFRVLNSFRSYALYVTKTFYPVNLAVYYPMPVYVPVLLAVVVAVAMLCVTCLVFIERKKAPWAVVGWLWFVGTLVPVIGLLQVGTQAMADRYSYIPSIGLLILIVWSLAAWTKSSILVERCGPPVVIIMMLLCMAVMRHQLSYWRDSITLFSHALDVTPSNAFSENNLGAALADAGLGIEAVPHYQAVLKLQPDDIKARYNLGIEYAATGRLADAVNNFNEALKRQPNSDLLNNNLGVVLARQNQLPSAIEHFELAIEQNPKYPKPYFNCAMAFQKQGRGDLAREHYEAALKVEPDWMDAMDHLAFLLANCPEKEVHDPARSIELAKKLNQRTGQVVPRYLKTLALSYSANGDFSNAVETAEIALSRAKLKNSRTSPDKIQNDLIYYLAGKMPPVDWENTTAFEIQR